VEEKKNQKKLQGRSQVELTDAPCYSWEIRRKKKKMGFELGKVPREEKGTKGGGCFKGVPVPVRAQGRFEQYTSA